MSDTTPLYVRLPSADAEALAAAAQTTGRSKRDLVGEAVRIHLGDGLTVGRATVAEPPREVLTIDEAAELLRIDPEIIHTAATNGELPARQLAGEWRLSRAALLAWLAAA